MEDMAALGILSRQELMHSYRTVVSPISQVYQ
jgi:hypothetical protein